jgi:hypothetical protein
MNMGLKCSHDSQIFPPSIIQMSSLNFDRRISSLFFLVGNGFG